MNYFLKKKKWLAWVIMLTFLFTSFMPSNIMAGNSVAEAAWGDYGWTDAQETQFKKQMAEKNDGGTLYYKGDKKQNNKYNSDVEISKVVSPTGVENEFDIELKVITKENVKELTTLKKEAAVVLVMDTSKSMQWADDRSGYCVECDEYIEDPEQHGGNKGDRDHNANSGDGVYAGIGSSKKDMRMTTAVNSADTFINEFAECFSDKALFSLVTFNADAEAERLSNSYWIDLKDSNNLKAAKNKIATLDDYDEKKPAGQKTTAMASGTNIAGGLQVAYNLLNDLSNDAPSKRYVILLTDGVPNRRMSDGSNDGYTITGSKENSSKYQTQATNVAGKLKDKATVYSVGFSKDVSSSSVKSFMQGLATSRAHYFYGATSGELTDEFEKVTESITLLANAWSVQDSMGEFIKFLGFYDSGSLKSELKNEKGVYCKISDEEINWDLKKTGAASLDGNDKAPWVYSLKYKIRLDTTADGFAKEAGKFVDTNQKATLTYVLDDKDTGKNYSGPYQVAFAKPQVKGYMAEMDDDDDDDEDIEFVKVDGDTEKEIPGVKFNLKLTDNHTTHTADSDYAKGVDAVSGFDDGKVDGDDGEFEFDNVPSGHIYILTETEAAAGYGIGGPWTVKVDYGKVTVTDKDDKPIAREEDDDDDGDFIIVNNKPAQNITFDKVDGSNAPLAGAQFKLYKQSNHNSGLGEVVGIATSTMKDGKATVTFKDIPYGTYYLQEYDFDGGNDGLVTIDGTRYAVDNTIYTVIVSKDGVTIIKSDGSEVTSIINNEAVGNITFTKVKAGDRDTKIDGVTFGLYTKSKYGNYTPYPDKTSQMTAVSDTNGVVTFKNVPYGTYYVHEIASKEGYLPNPGYYPVTVNAKGTRCLDNNTKTVPNVATTDLSVTKKWVDGNNQDGSRPAKVTFAVYADVSLRTLNETGYTFANNLPEKAKPGEKNKALAAIVTVEAPEENSTADTWTATVSGLPETTIDGNKINYTVKELGNYYTPIENSGKYTVTSGKKTYEYTVTYGENYTVTNTYQPVTTSLTVTKEWKGGDSDNNWISFKLYQTVDEQKELVKNGSSETFVINKVRGDWKPVTISNLPVYKNRQQITYSVEEEAVKDYVTTYSDPYKANNCKPGNITITNTLTGAGDITVTKVWKDDENRDGLRKNIEVQLQQKVDKKYPSVNEWKEVKNLPNNQSATQTLATGNNHNENVTHTWHDVPMYDGNGKAIQYRVVETTNLDGYKTTYAVGTADNSKKFDCTDTTGGLITADKRVVTITNTHTPETVKLQVEKTWAGDKDNKAKLNLTHNRPEKLQFTITGTVDGTTVDTYGDIEMIVDDTRSSQTMVVKVDGKDLPKYHDGKPITYTITEEAVEGYKTEYKSQTYEPSSAWFKFGHDKPDCANHTFKVTNELVKEKFSFTKEYSGINKPTDAARAEFTLTAVNPKNTGIGSVTKGATNDQNSYTFNDLKYGVVYKVEETTVPKGYEKAPVFYLKLEKNTDGEYVVKAYKDEICSTAVIAVTDITKDTGLYLAGTVYKLKNFVKTADFSFTKAFDSKKPGTMPTFTIKKIADAEGNIISSSEEKTVNVNDTDTYLFKDLECGTYSIEENTPDGYETVKFRIQVTDPGVGKSAVASVVAESGTILPVANGTGGYTLTNIAKTTDLTLLKTYNGVTPDSWATFSIQENGSNEDAETVSLGTNNLYTFEDLKYGKTYTVTEIAPTGYHGVSFVIDVNTTNDAGEPIATITDIVEGLTEGSQGTGYDYALENKVKTTGFQFNKVFEDNRNTTTPSFVAYQLTKDGQGTAQFKFDYSNVDGTHQYSLADGLEYGRTYAVVESDVPAGYEQAKPFYITIGVDNSTNKNACVTNAKGISKNEVGLYELKNVLKKAKYEIRYHYQQVADTIDVYVEEGEPRIVDAKVGDFINATNLSDNDKQWDAHVTTSSMYVFNAEKTASANDNKVVVENVDDKITVLDVYFDLRFAVQYHWKDADGNMHGDTTDEPVYDLKLNDLITGSTHQSPDDEAMQPDDPWYLFNGQWYATTQSAFEWNFDDSKQWLKGSDRLDQQNILNYVKDNVLHLYAAWSAKPAAKGNIQVSKTVQVVNEKEGNTDRDKLFEFALDLYVTTGSGLTFEEAKASATSPSALNFNVFFSDKDGLAFAQPEATLTDDKNGHYLYEFFLRDGDTVDFDVKAVTTSGSAYVYFQVHEVGAGENAPFDTELTGTEGALDGLFGNGCIGEESSPYAFAYKNIFTYEKDQVVPEEPGDGGGGNDGGGDTPPPPETEIPDEEVPLTEPEEPGEEIDIEDPEVPLAEVPGEEVEIEEPEVPLGDAPQTGDNSNTIPFVVLMLAAARGLVVTRRKFN